MHRILRRLTPLLGAAALVLSLAGTASAENYVAMGDSYSAGHDICATNPYTNGLQLLSPSDSYHPTRHGYRYGDVPAVRSIIG